MRARTAELPLLSVLAVVGAGLVGSVVLHAWRAGSVVVGLGLLLGGALVASCNQPAPTAATAPAGAPNAYFEPTETGVKTGGVQVIPITTPKGKFNIWTKRFGNNPKIKVLLLNGGPGATHEYFECMESFLPKEGVEFIYYDQLGCGNSDNPKDTSMWSLPRYVEEVE